MVRINILFCTFPSGVVKSSRNASCQLWINFRIDNPLNCVEKEIFFFSFFKRQTFCQSRQKWIWSSRRLSDNSFLWFNTDNQLCRVDAKLFVLFQRKMTKFEEEKKWKNCFFFNWTLVISHNKLLLYHSLDVTCVQIEETNSYKLNMHHTIFCLRWNKFPNKKRTFFSPAIEIVPSCSNYAICPPTSTFNSCNSHLLSKLCMLKVFQLINWARGKKSPYIPIIYFSTHSSSESYILPYPGTSNEFTVHVYTYFRLYHAFM